MYKFPYDIVDVEPELNAELLQYFKGELTGFVQVGPNKYFFPHKYKLEAHKYYNFQARPDDIWVVTFPRSGTTWTQELVWLIANNLDFNAAKTKPLSARFPFFEFPLFLHPEVKAKLLYENIGDSKKQEFIEHLSAPGYETLGLWPHNKKRFIKTHFPFSLLPPSVMENKCKVIYVARNPKDVAVSYYHLNRLYRTQGYIGDFSRYWSYFSRGLNPWLPYNRHIQEAYNLRHMSNVLFINYEEMISDLNHVILRIADFLGHQMEAEGLRDLAQHLDITNFRDNPAVNGSEMADVGILQKGEAGFVRKGGYGKREELMNDMELKKSIELWIESCMEKPIE